ncbi:hypothetical protein MBM_02631 [Drepanopeziza brunnea f. sp. 'multigermtubi' MB_m1]|uniref:Biogenesis of lysosome-related organelles complex 1 subunit 1 n=1 Tax=Marssonina brunnea f. sp. multigermtubi (strain MB_m1) TaxID=1072389 RepID=K1Y2K5_MARBU|nr:uncharacterized protein MBM_02631 [Drepanopeziza brunnea f. sp. 'multigermtubi' MB_m1]EKD19394.1 hypothetical protein MBM_02631 [Drepanopeziza brunnea f. sp. 'multigermtubi' MB_m1]
MSTHASTSSAPPPPLPRPRTVPPSISPSLAPSSHSTTNTHSPSLSASASSASPSIPSTQSPETQRQVAEARAALEASMTNIGSSLDRSLRSRAQNLHANSKQLSKQQADVVRATEGLRRESEKLGKLAAEGGRRVKELGNVQNWAEMLERDFLVLGETLRLVERGSASGSGSESGSSWESGSEEGGIGGGRGGRDGEALPGFEGEWKFEAEDDVYSTMGEGGLHTSGEERAVDADAAVRTIPGLSVTAAMDAEGDTVMDDAEGAHMDKGKGKAVEALADIAVSADPVVGGLTPGPTTTGSGYDPASGPVHTAASTAR